MSALEKGIMRWIEKRAAAEYLGVSEKSIERYKDKYNLEVKTESRPGRTRPVVLFLHDDLSSLKSKLSQTVYRPPVAITPKNLPVESIDVPRECSTTAVTTTKKEGDGERLLEFFRALEDRVIKTATKYRQDVPIEVKLLLSIREAQKLTGLSRDRLRQAIQTGGLKAQLIGRGWRVKRSDLERYIDGI